MQYFERVIMTSSSVEKNIARIVQSNFPLTEQPYLEIGRAVGLSETALIEKLAELKSGGLVREISAVINPHSLGYKTTLVAMHISQNRLDLITETILAHPMISHAYIRNHHFNFWITFAVSPKHDVSAEVVSLGQKSGVEQILSLPAIKTYKLKAILDGFDKHSPFEHRNNTGSVALDPLECRVLEALQQDLSLEPVPFAIPAEKIGITTHQLFSITRGLMQKGVVKRYGANINHNSYGYRFNAMTCLEVDDAEADKMGGYFASLKLVSHCYLRKADPLFPYNFYAMVHCQNQNEYHVIMKNAEIEAGIGDYIALVSAKEIKKKRNCYIC